MRADDRNSWSVLVKFKSINVISISISDINIVIVSITIVALITL